MKIRLKFNNIRKIVEFDSEESQTLSSLNRKTKILYGLSTSSDLKFSLNGAEDIEADEQTSLTSLGIVSGDLILVKLDGVVTEYLDNSNTQEPSTSNRHDDPNSLSSSVNSSNIVSHMEASISTTDTVTKTSPQTSPDVKGSKNQYLNQPMLVRESTGRSISLNLLHALSTHTPATPHEAIYAVLKVLMAESGFAEVQNSRVVADDKTEGGADNGCSSVSDEIPGGLSSTYRHRLCGDNLFYLVYVPMASIAVIHGMVEFKDKPDNFSCSMQIKVTHFLDQTYLNITPAGQIDYTKVFKELPKLSNCFKDQVSYPLQQKGRSDEYRTPGLTSLITELKIEIMLKLGISELLHLSEVSREFNFLAQEAILWRNLYTCDFGDCFRLLEDRNKLNWKSLYIKQYKEKLERRRYLNTLKDNMNEFYTPRLMPYGTGPPAAFPAGIRGGQSDLYPTGFPGSNGAHRLFQPARPRFLPTNPLHDPFRDPYQRPSPSWDRRSGGVNIHRNRNSFNRFLS